MYGCQFLFIKLNHRLFFSKFNRIQKNERIISRCSSRYSYTRHTRHIYIKQSSWNFVVVQNFRKDLYHTKTNLGRKNKVKVNREEQHWHMCSFPAVNLQHCLPSPVWWVPSSSSLFVPFHVVAALSRVETRDTV